jgi:hypothetical protein
MLDLRQDSLALLRLLVLGPMRRPLPADTSWEAVADLRDKKFAIWVRHYDGHEYLEASVAGLRHLDITVVELDITVVELDITVVDLV